MSHNVAILLCTYQGGPYLAEQLESFGAQTHTAWTVWASDDGSRDTTHDVLKSYQQTWGPDRLLVRAGPRKGFAANFMSLVCREEIVADYYAMSDQDDLWHADKLERAVQWLNTVPSDVPALYCTRTELVDEGGGKLGYSPLFTRPPSFRNALVQNVAGGNTMVFNHAARELLKAAGPDVKIAAHDWWVYIVVSGCGGKVFYDPTPSLLYRQHAENLIGANTGVRARIERIGKLFRGHLKTWTDQHVVALEPIIASLSRDNLSTFERFTSARKRSLIPRVFGIWRSGIYRQTPLGNLGLLIAAILNRI
ncbi:glycosyltransferase family 2 protein [Achromobacter sp. NFACC18-2]|uniref:glycosyltransferase family 2 protein n=1 Tax=Achromobacter sp. NFACC18-2 TaxID=1564112 RepID=UPI0008C1E4BF|nr:glycosyltransferase family 2 protein [Achromobacter sp. NFACC18-2]SEJ41474.1 Glycosyltransferase involved in cell wall bisynthesis [Achromobacter sp. NFACC18-2]